MAVAALAYAGDQINEARLTRQAALRQARATFLLELDRRFESEEVKSAVQAFATMRRQEMQRVGDAHRDLSDQERRSRAAHNFSDMLTALRNSADAADIAKYRSFIPFISFLETLGVMAKRDYVALNDIDALFRGPILDFGAYFGPHILYRQKEAGVPEGLFENALYLVSRIDELPH